MCLNRPDTNNLETPVLLKELLKHFLHFYPVQGGMSNGRAVEESKIVTICFLLLWKRLVLFSVVQTISVEYSSDFIMTRTVFTSRREGLVFNWKKWKKRQPTKSKTFYLWEWHTIHLQCFKLQKLSFQTTESTNWKLNWELGVTLGE